MDAAEALTVMPRSLSTASVSRMVISSLLSFLLLVLLLLLKAFVTWMDDDDDDDDDSSDIDDNEDLLLPGILLPGGKSSSSHAGVSPSSPPLSYFSSLFLPNWYAVHCLSRPRLPVYSSIRDAKLDFP